MLGSNSFIEGFNVYVVENIIQTAFAFALILAVLRLLSIRDPDLRIRLLLLPTLIPFLAPPIYYFLFPIRREMPVLALDRLFDIERILSLTPYPDVILAIMTVGIVSVGAFVALKGALSIAVVLYLSRHYKTLKRGDDLRLDVVLERCLARAGIPSPVILLRQGASYHCCVVGLGRAYLVISQGCLRELNDEQLESVLAHELAHIRRGDNVLSLFLFIQRHLLFFNPLIHVIHRQILDEVENACDQQTLCFGLRPRAYARNLLEVWRISKACPQEPWPLASHLLSDKKTLERRVSYLLDPVPAQKPPWCRSWIPVFVSPALILGLFFLC